MDVGHGVAFLDVPEGTVLGGYADRLETSQGTLDELEVHSIAISSGTSRLILIVLDLICVNPDLAFEVRRAVLQALGDIGRPLTDVWVSATHTHSGPDVGCEQGGSTTPPLWKRHITYAAVSAAIDSVRAEGCCQTNLFKGNITGVGARRGQLNGEPCVPVEVLTFRKHDGVGVLVVAPVHPTVLPAGSSMVSSDLSGAIRDELQTALADRFADVWVVVATGAAGDVSTRLTRREQTHAECRRLGTHAALQIAALLETAPTYLWSEEEPHLISRRATVLLPSRVDDSSQLLRLRRDLSLLSAPRNDSDSPAVSRITSTAIQGVEVALARTRQPRVDHYALELSAARLGGLTLLGIGGEPFLSIRHDLLDRIDGPCIVLGYTNGYVGYLVDAPAYQEPGYEMLSSPFECDVGENTISALIELAHLNTEGTK